MGPGAAGSTEIDPLPAELLVDVVGHAVVEDHKGQRPEGSADALQPLGRLAVVDRLHRALQAVPERLDHLPRALDLPHIPPPVGHPVSRLQPQACATPFVLILRELNLGQVRSWDDLLKACFCHWTARLLGRKRYAEDVEALLKEGKAMIVLDGLDEVGSTKVQENLREAVWEGMERYDGCRWLLTSRLVGYLGYHEKDEREQGKDVTVRFGSEYAALRYVAPFADGQVKNFAYNWFGSRDRSAQRAGEDARRFLKAVHSNLYTLRLARIPNLLTMMALIYRERAKLPDGRALLYTDIADAYLRSIDESRRINRRYSLREQKQWLGRIGFEMQMRRHERATSKKSRDKEILAEGSDVRRWVIEAMRSTGRKETDEEAVDAFLDEVCRRSGLLLPRGEDQFAFTHGPALARLSSPCRLSTR